MDIISAPRGTGKTTKLVYDLLEHENAVLVVSTHQRKESMRVIVEEVMRRKGLLRIERDDSNVMVRQSSPAQRVDAVMQRVISCGTVNQHELLTRRRTPVRVLVDDLEDVLFYFLGTEVAVATAQVRP